MIDYFSQIHILLMAMYCIIFVGDVAELMLTMAPATVKGQLFVGQISHLETAVKWHYKQCTNGHFNKKGFTRTTLSITLSKFVEENELNFLYTHQQDLPGA